MKWKDIKIDISDPVEILNLYSDRILKINDWESLTLEQLDIVYIYIVSDFYDNGLGIEVLIGIAELIDSKLMGKGNKEFSSVINSIADLDYCFRKITNEEKSALSVINAFKDLYLYFEKNKSKISPTAQTV